MANHILANFSNAFGYFLAFRCASKHIFMTPRLGGGLTNAKASLHSMYWKISVG